MIKYLGILLVTGLMVVSIAVIDARSDLNTTPAPPPKIHENIYAPGVVEGATREIELRAEVFGRVVEVLVSTGDWVEAGDELVRLDRRRQTQLVLASRASLELAEAQLQRLANGAREEERDEARALFRAREVQLEQAFRTWNRVKELRHQGAIAQQEADDQQGLVDRLKAELDAARARIDQLTAPARADELRGATARVAAAEAEHELAKLALEKTALTAPCQGRVLDLDVEPGEIVGPEIPGVVVSISDTSTLNIRAFIEEHDAPRVCVGMPVQIVADGLPGQVFQGELFYLSPHESKELSYRPA